MKKMKPIDILKKILKPYGKEYFLSTLPQQISLLDVGCGNNSPYRTKAILPYVNYTGIDIGDYNQTKPNLADNYIITQSADFTKELLKLKSKFDAVVSNHNLEHCDDRNGTLLALLKALKLNGKLYLAFPCEQSINYPSRYGTLNYYDDSTHKGAPPNFDHIIKTIKNNGFEIIYESRNYRPIILRMIGMIIEPYSIMRKRVFPGTWSYWGFESIIIARKLTND